MDLGLGGYGSEDEEGELNAEPGLQPGIRVAGAEETNPSMKAVGPLSGLVGGYSEDEDGGAEAEENGAAEAAGDGQEDAVQRTENQGEDTAPDPSTSSDPFSVLPPELANAPPGQPPPGVVDKFKKFLATMRTTKRCLNDELKRHKGYRNPDLLTKLVEHQGIKELGTAFSEEVYNPETLSGGNYIDSLVKQLEAEQLRRKELREQVPPNQPGGGIDFHRGSGALGIVMPSLSAGAVGVLPRSGSAAPAAPAPVGLNVAVLRQQAALNAAAINAAAAESAKRTKWDTGK